MALHLENEKKLDLIEQDLRLRSLALTRIETFDPKKALSHEQMMEKYAK